MYARSMTVRGEPAAVDSAVAYVRDDVLWRVQRLPGCAGLSMLTDRTSGRCIVTTAWETEEARRASSEETQGLREHLADLLGGELELAEWEIALLHRRRHADEGAGTRVTWTRVDPAHVDRMLDEIRMVVLPRLEDVPGFASLSAFVDCSGGRCATAATYETRGALERSQSAVSVLREQVAAASGAAVTEVAEFDLALAHLRVPETV